MLVGSKLVGYIKECKLPHWWDIYATVKTVFERMSITPVSHKCNWKIASDQQWDVLCLFVEDLSFANKASDVNNMENNNKKFIY